MVLLVQCERSLKNVSCVAHLVAPYSGALSVPAEDTQWAFSSVMLTCGERLSPFSGRFRPRLPRWSSSPDWPSPHKTPLCRETENKEGTHNEINGNSFTWNEWKQVRHTGKLWSLRTWYLGLGKRKESVKRIYLQTVPHLFQWHRLAVPEAAHLPDDWPEQLPLCFWKWMEGKKRFKLTSMLYCQRLSSLIGFQILHKSTNALWKKNPALRITKN